MGACLSMSKGGYQQHLKMDQRAVGCSRLAQVMCLVVCCWLEICLAAVRLGLYDQLAWKRFPRLALVTAWFTYIVVLLGQIIFGLSPGPLTSLFHICCWRSCPMSFNAAWPPGTVLRCRARCQTKKTAARYDSNLERQQPWRWSQVQLSRLVTHHNKSLVVDTEEQFDVEVDAMFPGESTVAVVMVAL